MDQVIVAVDPGVGIEPKAFAAAWNDDPELAAAAVASVEPAGQGGQGTFLPGLVEFVVLPLVINLVSGLLYDGVRRAVRRARAQRDTVEVEVDVQEHTLPSGERVVVIRTRREVV